MLSLTYKEKSLVTLEEYEFNYLQSGAFASQSDHSLVYCCHLLAANNISDEASIFSHLLRRIPGYGPDRGGGASWSLYLDLLFSVLVPYAHNSVHHTKSQVLAVIGPPAVNKTLHERPWVAWELTTSQRYSRVNSYPQHVILLLTLCLFTDFCSGDHKPANVKK